jgi:hypothetical protein
MKWTAQNIARLTALMADHPDLSTAMLAKHIGTTRWSIVGILRRLGKPMAKQARHPKPTAQEKFWTPERNARLRELWFAEPFVQTRDIANEFGITRNAVTDRARWLGLPGRAAKSQAARTPPKIVAITPEASRAELQRMAERGWHPVLTDMVREGAWA